MEKYFRSVDGVEVLLFQPHYMKGVMRIGDNFFRGLFAGGNKFPDSVIRGQKGGVWD